MKFSVVKTKHKSSYKNTVRIKQAQGNKWGGNVFIYFYLFPQRVTHIGVFWGHSPHSCTFGHNISWLKIKDK